ncbi:MAG: hypothetical protein ACLFT8_06710 [Desulfovermiculus sp.]
MNQVNLQAISLRFRHVWFRNLTTYRRIWKVNFMVPLLEPGFYILAFGLGFSGLIGGVKYAGMSLEYTQFMAPALVATACMWNAFFETTYASFVRMYFQRPLTACWPLRSPWKKSSWPKLCGLPPRLLLQWPSCWPCL